MFSPNIIVFDFECTGFSHNYERVIDIGAVNLATGEMFQTLVNPEIKQIPQEVVELTHITNEMVINAPSQKDAFVAFRDFISDCTILLGHNVTFDLRHLTASFDRLGIPYNSFCYIDTQSIMTKLHPDEGRKLCDVCNYYNVINEAAHRAYDDAVATAEVYKAMIIDAINLSDIPLADARILEIFAAKPFVPKTQDSNPAGQISFFPNPQGDFPPAPQSKAESVPIEPATEKQVNYLKYLASKTGEKIAFDKLTKRSAMALIGKLKEQVG